MTWPSPYCWTAMTGILPKRGVFLLAVREAQHGTRAACGSEFEPDRFLRRRFDRPFDRRPLEFDRQKIFEDRPAIRVRREALARDHDERAAETGNQFVEVFQMRGAHLSRIDVAEDHEVVLEQLLF